MLNGRDLRGWADTKCFMCVNATPLLHIDIKFFIKYPILQMWAGHGMSFSQLKQPNFTAMWKRQAAQGPSFFIVYAMGLFIISCLVYLRH